MALPIPAVARRRRTVRGAKICVDTPAYRRRVRARFIVERRAPESYQRASEILPWRCAPCGNEWTPAGSAAFGRCLRCLTPRPTPRPKA